MISSFKSFLTETYHPKPDDQGNRVKIEKQSTASDEGSWHDASRTATFTPESNSPEHIAGIPITKIDSIDYRGIKEIDEPAITPTKKISTGVIMIEPDNRVWIHEPTNHFGDYEHSFPKGKLDAGLTLQQNAVKETHEETGLHAQITGHLGDYEGDTSTTRYYLGKRTGGDPSTMGWESQSVKLVPVGDLHKYLNRPRDKQIATDLINRLRRDK